MKRNKRIIGIFVLLILVLGTPNTVLALSGVVTNTSGKIVPSKAIAYMKPEFAVQLNQEMQIFKDVKGQRVYPIVYNGNTYLPVRAVAALMGEDVQWDNFSKTVYIGKTLSNPNKSKAKKTNDTKGAIESVDKDEYIKPSWKSSEIIVSVSPDITIMYDFEIQKFVDISGVQIYPIVYQESTYLPVRSISELMKKPITWDNTTKTILIGDNTQNQDNEKEDTIYTKRLKEEFESSIELYDQANTKIVNLQKTTDAAMKLMLAESISADVQTAEKQTISVNNMKKSKMSKEEEAAQAALYDYLQISENYLLVLENIAYLSSSGKDYSLLSDTFVSLALDSQSKMNAARKLIDAL